MEDDEEERDTAITKTKQDISEAIRPSESGIIESVMLTTDREGYKMAIFLKELKKILKKRKNIKSKEEE